MNKPKVVITDYYYESIHQEAAVMAEIGAELRDYHCQTEDEVIAAAAGCDALICQFAPITRKVIESLDKCKVIVRYAIGVDNIDVAAAEERGIYVCNVPDYPCNIVALSSHTKVMYINEKAQIEASNTTISGQFYEAIVNSTNIGKSIIPVEGEEAGGYSDEELIQIAADCVRHAGLGRTMLMPRFLQVLMKTNSHERQVFIDAAIAADDLNAFREMREQGYNSNYYLLYGHESRCKMYTYMLREEFGPQLTVCPCH